jgi:TonB family protein
MTEAWTRWEGQVVDGKFYLLQFLGGNENGAVFLAEPIEQEPRRVAIKLLLAPPKESELQLSRWEMAAKLSHPHLIRLFKMGRCQLGDARLLYVVMEYADEDLSQVLPHQPLTPADGREILEPVLDALAYLHGQGFVHGRVKPTNIMGVEDQLKISSDGLRRIGEHSVCPGEPGAYDAPEMAWGEISPAADVWSLGMTLVEGLTQRLPVWDSLEQGEPSLPETLPTQFIETARHCLRRDPQCRWPIADIVTNIRQTLPQERKCESHQATSHTWRYLVPAAVLGLVLTATLAVPRLFKGRRESATVPSITAERSGNQPDVTQTAMTPKAGNITKTPGAKKQSSLQATPARAQMVSERGSATTAGLVTGKIVYQVLPNVPRKARETIRGKVRVGVKVHVDPLGNVAEATLDSPGPSRYFAQLALKAARRWKFRPAEIDARNAPSEWVLRFEFGKAGTTVHSGQTNP